MTDREPTAIEALRERVALTLKRSMNVNYDGGWEKAAEAVLSLIAPLPVLAWAANNPETLAALASGEMVAVKSTALYPFEQVAKVDDWYISEVVPQEVVFPLAGARLDGGGPPPVTLTMADFRALAAALPDPNPTDNPPMAMTEGR